jgi:hypothetical protein
MDHVADAMNVDDDEVLAIGVDDALQLADHIILPCRPIGWAGRDGECGAL